MKVVIFSDFLCSHCATLHFKLEPLLKENANNLSITFRHFANQDMKSQQLSKASICADQQNQFLTVADTIFKHQKEITSATLLEKLSSSAKKLNAEQFNTCMTNSFVDQIIAEDMKEVARLGLRGTPTIIVNGFLGNISLIQTELSRLTK